MKSLDNSAEQLRKEKTRAARLPSGLVLDRILRYEAALEKELYRATAMLDHLQAVRKGKAIPHLV